MLLCVFCNIFKDENLCLKIPKNGVLTPTGVLQKGLSICLDCHNKCAVVSEIVFQKEE